MPRGPSARPPIAEIFLMLATRISFLHPMKV
jgi:hypothetical protein